MPAAMATQNRRRSFVVGLMRSAGWPLPLVSPLAAENHGGEFGAHGDVIFYFCVFAKFFIS